MHFTPTAMCMGLSVTDTSHSISQNMCFLEKQILHRTVKTVTAGHQTASKPTSALPADTVHLRLHNIEMSNCICSPHEAQNITSPSWAPLLAQALLMRLTLTRSHLHLQAQVPAHASLHVQASRKLHNEQSHVHARSNVDATGDMLQVPRAGSSTLRFILEKMLTSSPSTSSGASAENLPMT